MFFAEYLNAAKKNKSSEKLCKKTSSKPGHQHFEKISHEVTENLPPYIEDKPAEKKVF
jgi:hypothetical protein